MKTILGYAIGYILIFLCNELSAQIQPLPKQWDKRFGGKDDDQLTSMKQTKDKGYILGGFSYSGKGGDKSKGSKSPGLADYWIVKTDSNGIKEWDKTYGGSDRDELTCVIQTNDGGYMLGGLSSSPKSGDKSAESKGFLDYWILKLDASGNKTWDSTYGGDDDDQLIELVQTTGGGYMLGGHSRSNASGDKSANTRENTAFTHEDYWVIKINSKGKKQWDSTYGGYYYDYLTDLQQTNDGGYILGGYSSSDIGGEKTESNQGQSDYWIVKITSTGQKQWDKTYGGISYDDLTDLEQTTDNGYILGGISSSDISGDKTENLKGLRDYWLVKINSSGSKIWDKDFGSGSSSYLAAIKQCTDGGYLFAGNTNGSNNYDKTYAGRGRDDYWVIKTDASGSKLWDTDFGGSDIDIAIALTYNTNGYFTIGGYSRSLLGADKTEGSRGDFDYWILKAACPPYAKIKVKGSLDICATDSIKLAANDGYGLKYQWLKDNIKIPNATKKSLIVKTPGIYSVTVSAGTDCKQTSDGVEAINSCGKVSSGLDQLQNNVLSIFPNPSNGDITLNYTSGSNEHIKLFVFDRLGNVVFNNMEYAFKNNNSYHLNLSNLIPGMYTLLIINDKQYNRRSFVIKK